MNGYVSYSVSLSNLRAINHRVLKTILSRVLLVINLYHKLIWSIIFSSKNNNLIKNLIMMF